MYREPAANVERMCEVENDMEAFEQTPLIDQPISFADVAAYLEALHTAREREAEIAADLKEAKDDTKEALRNLRKIRQRVNAAAARDVHDAVGDALQRFTDLEERDGIKVSFSRGHSAASV